MKRTITLLAMGTLIFNTNAQNIVTTQTANRVAIVEEFTGTSCPACPAGHTVLDGILTANTDRVFGVGYSPTNSTLTGPWNGGLDLTNPFSNVFYTNPYYGNGDGRVMPSAHINRTKYGGSRKSSTSVWASRVAGIIALSSPVNVGLSSTYTASTDMVDVTVEMYFTSAVTEATYVTVLLIESDIITTQGGATGNYTHKHVMRANLQAGQWGDALTGTTNQGDLVTMNFSYDNSSTNYVIDNSDIVAFVSTGTDDASEILSGFQVQANGGSGSVSGIESLAMNQGSMTIFPNPANNELNILLSENINDAELSIYSITGDVLHKESINGTSGSLLTYNTTQMGLSSGTYFVSVLSDNNRIVKKLIIR
jgi:hypothetical protein